MLYFLITIKKRGQNLRYLSWKNVQKNDRTFTLKIHRLYAPKNKGADITSNPLSFLIYVYGIQKGISSSNESIAGSG